VTILEDTRQDFFLTDFVFDVDDYHLEPFRASIDGSSSLTFARVDGAATFANANNANGRRTFRGDTGHVIFEPKWDYFGPLFYEFNVTDSDNVSTPVVLGFDVINVNDAPRFGDAEIRTGNTTDGGWVSVLDLSFNFNCAPGRCRSRGFFALLSTHSPGPSPLLQIVLTHCPFAW
jgi:hypothetical protein